MSTDQSRTKVDHFDYFEQNGPLFIDIFKKLYYNSFSKTDKILMDCELL